MRNIIKEKLLNLKEKKIEEQKFTETGILKKNFLFKFYEKYIENIYWKFFVDPILILYEKRNPRVEIYYISYLINGFLINFLINYLFFYVKLKNINLFIKSIYSMFHLINVYGTFTYYMYDEVYLMEFLIDNFYLFTALYLFFGKNIYSNLIKKKLKNKK